MFTYSNDCSSSILEEAYKATLMGIIKIDYSQQVITIFNHEVLGLDKTIFAFDEIDKYLTINLENLISLATSSSEDCFPKEKQYPVYSPAKGLIWVNVYHFKKELDKENHVLSWASFKVIDKINDDTLSKIENYKNIVVRQNNIAKNIASFLTAKGIKESINSILAEILHQLKASRCYIFEYDLINEFQVCRYEVVSEGISPEIETLQTLPMSATPYWNNIITQNKPLILSDIKEYPPEFKSEYEILARQNITSIMLVPMPYKEAIWGYLGVDVVGEKRDWTSLDHYLLSSLSTIIGVCMQLYYSEESTKKLLQEKIITEKELVTAKNKAEAMDRLKSSFLASMSHEIRTPLNAIMGFTNILMMSNSGAFSSEAKYYLSIIKSNSETLLQLISDILDLSKIESGKIELHHENVNINALLREIVFSHNLETQKGVYFKILTPLKECNIRTDKNRITQVIVNLISNAIKFTDQGTITIGYNVSEQKIEFYVEDTGRGIPKDQIDNIFLSFVKINSFAPGSGLGLSICKNIVEQMDGTIEVTSEVGKGSRFSFSIPYISVNNFEIPPQFAAGGVFTSNNNDPVILIVEDNESSFMLLSALLKSYALLWAEDGVSALDMYYKHKPDLIIMDIRLPKEDGLTTTKKIREVDKRTPILALTANAYAEDRTNAINAGCNEFITKPVNLPELKELVIKYLSK